MDKNLAAELAPGLVVHLCPKTMLSLGAKVTGPAETWVEDFHFFLVLSADAKRCELVPLMSNESYGRQLIPREGRSGHPKWTEGTWNFHPAQVWTVSRHTVARAAAVGGDKSTSGSRNILAREHLPVLKT